MDSIRTKKSTKKAWIVGITLILGVIIIGLIVCLAISGVFDSDNDEKEVKVNVPTITTVPQAFEFIDEVYKKVFTGDDEVTVEHLKTLESIKKEMISRLDEKKQAEDEEKKLKEQELKDKQVKEAETNEAAKGGDKLEAGAVGGTEGGAHLTTNKDKTGTPASADGKGNGSEDNGEKPGDAGGKTGGPGSKETPEAKTGKTDTPKTESKIRWSIFRRGP